MNYYLTIMESEQTLVSELGYLGGIVFGIRILILFGMVLSLVITQYSQRFSKKYRLPISLGEPDSRSSFFAKNNMQR